MSMNNIPYAKEFVDYLNLIDKHNVIEVSETTFDYMLGVLPPKSMGKHITIPILGEVRTSFGFAEGEENLVYFFERGDKFYAHKSDTINMEWRNY